MSSRQKIAIIGAGIAGLACARRLSDTGLKVVVFDKGRNAGGRAATRCVAGKIQFDHGAQYFTARSPAFSSVLEKMLSCGAAALWDDGCGKIHFVGVPGMNSLAGYLGRDLEIHQSTEVVAVRPALNGWAVDIGLATHQFDMVVITTPAPQIIDLLRQPGAFADELEGVEFDPCLTLMAALEPLRAPPFVTRTDADDALAWIAEDSSKPDRGTEACWVAQASPSWSAKYLNSDSETIAAMMLPMLCDRLGITNAKVRYVTAHRWRYAKVSEPLGKPFIRHTSGTLYAGGDWCLGARLEAAWTSGDSIARDILGSA
jgi:renalase